MQCWLFSSVSGVQSGQQTDTDRIRTRTRGSRESARTRGIRPDGSCGVARTRRTRRIRASVTLPPTRKSVSAATRASGFSSTCARQCHEQCKYTAGATSRRGKNRHLARVRLTDVYIRLWRSELRIRGIRDPRTRTLSSKDPWDPRPADPEQGQGPVGPEPAGPVHEAGSARTRGIRVLAWIEFDVACRGTRPGRSGSPRIV